MNARKLMGLATTAILIAGLSVPANAAETYRILVGAYPGMGTSTYPLFINSVTSCNPTYAPTGTNEPGIDWKLVDVKKYAGRTIRIGWSSTSIGLDASLDTLLFNTQCKAGSSKFGVTASAFTVQIPTTGKWMLVAPNFTADVSFTITLV